MAGKKSQTSNYNDYVTSLRSIISVGTPADFPHLLVTVGPSSFLQLKACQAVVAAWNKLNVGAAESMEASDLDQADFQSLWSQKSLFEPESLYVLRRANSLRNLGGWLASIKSPAAMKSHILIECGDKLSAEISKHVSRLQGTLLPCVEPETSLEFAKVAHALARRAGLDLDDEAVRLIIEASGLDLGRVENEINVLSLQFHGRTSRLTRADIAGSVGCMKEDDVFELFNLLRGKRISQAHLMSEQFLARGESAIALTGIFARYSRDQIERGTLRRGISGLKACAHADRKLKSSRVDEGMVISNVIESLAEG